MAECLFMKADEVLKIWGVSQSEALDIGIRYLTSMAFFSIILYLLHVFQNVLQAIDISVRSMYSGITELVGRVFMA